jgi:hypothetical protein
MASSLIVAYSFVRMLGPKETGTGACAGEWKAEPDKGLAEGCGEEKRGVRRRWTTAEMLLWFHGRSESYSTQADWREQRVK